MKFLSIIIFLLFPSIVFGGVGDVYYCTGKNLVMITDFEVTQYKNQNFKFKRLKNNINFGSDDNYFEGTILDTKIYDIDSELFSFGHGGMSILRYDNGNFYYSQTTYNNIGIVTGTCSIF